MRTQNLRLGFLATSLLVLACGPSVGGGGSDDGASESGESGDGDGDGDGDTDTGIPEPDFGFPDLPEPTCEDGPSLHWEAWYQQQTEFRDEARDVAVDSAGSIVVVGVERLGQSGVPPAPVWVRKHDPEGEELWTRVFHGAYEGDDIGDAIEIDQNDDIYVAGGELVDLEWAVGEDPFPLIDRNPWVRKLSPDGDIIWHWSDDFAPADLFEEEDGDWARDLALLDGDVVVVGGEFYDETQRWIRRLDGETGAEQWHELQAAGTDVATDGQAIFATHDTTLEKRSADGTLLWAIDPFPDGDIDISEVAVDPGGDVWLIATDRTPNNELMLRAAKLDAEGVGIWDVELGVEGARPSAFLSPDKVRLGADFNDVGELLVGSGVRDENNAVHPWFARLAPDGEILWADDEDYQGHATAVAALGDCEMIAAGSVDFLGWVAYYGP